MLIRSALSFGLAFLVLVAATASAQTVTMSAEEAKRVLSEPPPRKYPSNAEMTSAWERRLQAAIAAGQLESQAEALQYLADAQTTSDARYRLLDQLVQAYYRAGQVGKSLAVRDAITTDRRVSPGRRSIVASDLALSIGLAGETARSQRLISRAKSLANEATPEEIEGLPNEPLVLALRAEGQIAYRQSDITRAVQTTRNIADASIVGMTDKSRSSKRRDAAARNFIVNTWFHTVHLAANGRARDALLYAQQVLDQYREFSTAAPTLQDRASVAYSIARAYAVLGNYSNALQSIEESLQLYAKAGVVAHENTYIFARRQRALIKLALGRIEETGEDLSAIQEARAVSPVVAGNTNAKELAALMLAQQGKWEEAAATATDLVADMAHTLGTDSTWYKSRRALELVLLLNTKSYSPSKASVTRYVDGLASSTSDWSDGTQRGLELEYAALESHLDLILRNGGMLEAEDAKDVAFKIAELLKLDLSQGALADGAAKMAAANPELRSLIEREQTLRSDRSDVRRLAVMAMANEDRVAKGGDAQVLARQKADTQDKVKALQASEGKLAELRREIGRRFPAYRELISPRIPTPAELAKALGPGEAYVNLFPGREAGYAFVVTRDGQLTAHRVGATEARVQGYVRQFTSYFEKGEPPQRPLALEGLDVSAGHRIFADWLAPLSARLGNTDAVYVAASGALAAVPWNALPMGSEGALADLKWAVQERAFVTLPGASALVLTKAFQGTAAGQPFIAFAHPSFDGDVGIRPEQAVRTVRAAPLPSASIKTKFDYRTVAPLPETLDEAREIAATLGVNPSTAVIHGVDATRTRAMKANLVDFRVVAFATHGLLPGEIPGFDKPGLAMAYEGKGLEDSILSIDDVANMRLNAQWVLLSACNTGYNTGRERESMSALSRAFFAAGARTLLATAWAVESNSAKILTVDTFGRFASDQRITKAQAFAQAQRSMLAGKHGDLYRHPYFWGAYYVVGDAGR